MKRSEVVAYARTWVGTPFVPQQRVRGHGGDCVAMVEGAGLHFGVIAKGFRTDYGPIPNMREIMQALKSSGCTRLRSINDRKPGDILFIQYSAQPQHLGILTDDNHIVHGYSMPGKYVETILNSRLLDGLRQVWRIPGIED